MAHPLQPREITRASRRIDLPRARAIRLLEASGAGAESVPTRDPEPHAPSLEWARSGAMALSGSPEGAPRLARGPVATAACGAGLAIAALSREPAHATRDWSALLGERAALFGFARRGMTSCGGHARLLEAEDGWLALQLPRQDDWRLVPAWLESDAPAALEAALDPGDDVVAARAWAEIAAAIRARRVEALVARARLMGLAAAPAARSIPTDGSGWTLDATTETLPRSLSISEDRPLRVLDLSTLWAGPLATSLLAECGADVVKVESPARPDGARAGEPRFFSLMNAGKTPAALDLRDATDRARFEALLDRADVVVESARPRALAQLGYDASHWVGNRAGRLWVSITGYGRDHEWIAFGDDAAIAAGLAWSDDRDAPAFCGDAIADPLTGLHAAALVLAHRRAGRGGLLSLSLADIAADCAREPDPTSADARVERNERGDGWQVRCGAAIARVASPRARPATAAAPPLSPPSHAVFARWRART